MAQPAAVIRRDAPLKSTRMGRSQARPPLRVLGGRVHDDKDELDGTLIDDATTPYGPHARFRRSTPDLESESEWEEATAHAAHQTHLAAANRIVSSVQGDEPVLTGLSDRTGLRVRFRSRVRISGGLGRRRRRPSDGLASSASSISGSPSSSISVPLRTHYTGSNGWGPLGTRVKFAASQAALIPPRQDDDANGGKGNSSGGNARRRCTRSYSWPFIDDDTDEHTHLLMSPTRYSYVGTYAHDSCHDDRERELERRWREHLVDETFGRWPTRLLNRHWWWWHVEPILCCFCDPDEEDF